MMIIANLPYMKVVSFTSEIKVKGGARKNNYDNRAGALAFSYANSRNYENIELEAASLTSVYIEPRISQARSSSEARVRPILS